MLKTKRLYTVGEELDTDDIQITVQNGSGQYTVVDQYTTNAAEIDMTPPAKRR